MVLKLKDGDMSGMGLKKIPFRQPMTWQVSMIYKEEFEQNELVRSFRDYTLEYVKNNLQKT